MTGGVACEVILVALPSLRTQLEMNEMSINELHRALKAVDISEAVVLRPDLKLHSSSLVDETVLDETKAALKAHSKSSILKNPSYPYYIY